MADAISGITSRMAQRGAYGQGPLGGLGVDTGAIKVPAGAPGVGGSGGADGASFGDTLKQFIGGVSDAQDAAGELRDKFVRGEGVEMHQVMAASEEASISLEMMVELRNKVTEAYRTLVSMQ